MIATRCLFASVHAELQASSTGTPHGKVKGVPEAILATIATCAIDHDSVPPLVSYSLLRGNS